MEALTPLLALPVIPELGRKISLEMGYEYPGQITDQEGFKKKVLDEQIAEERRLGNFLSDRSVVDAWVLWQRWNICQAMSYDTESYYLKARAQSEFYTEIIYIPPMFAAVDDGVRWTDADYQRQIDRLVRMTLWEWNLLERTYTVKSADNRLNEVRDWLGERGALED